jgi:hypothetical protein
MTVGKQLVAVKDRPKLQPPFYTRKHLAVEKHSCAMARD